MKFRVWCNDRNEWETHNTCLRSDGQLLHLNRGAIMPLRPSTHAILLYTGFTDKNGKEMYEGDIVRIKGEPPFTFDYKRVLELRNGIFGHKDQYQDEHRSINKDTRYYEVIGNIFESPELFHECS